MRILPTVLVISAAFAAAALPPLAAQAPAAGSPPPATVGAADPGTILYPRAPASLGSPAKDAPPMGGTVMTGFVVLAGAAGGWLLWRRLRGGVQPAGRNEHKLAIAETRSLGNRQYLVVAAYGDRRFLLGVCPGKIDLISPLDGGAPSLDR